ncbi:hypothetical protein C8R48DRAFT_699928 [Suillus tomentosus]|nr:hypothetical protein C8R48DRAFT_699928 [Suillus tomentosus]
MQPAMSIDIQVATAQSIYSACPDVVTIQSVLLCASREKLEQKCQRERWGTAREHSGLSEWRVGRQT